MLFCIGETPCVYRLHPVARPFLRKVNHLFHFKDVFNVWSLCKTEWWAAFLACSDQQPVLPLCGLSFCDGINTGWNISSTPFLGIQNQLPYTGSWRLNIFYAYCLSNPRAFSCVINTWWPLPSCELDFLNKMFVVFWVSLVFHGMTMGQRSWLFTQWI